MSAAAANHKEDIVVDADLIAETNLSARHAVARNKKKIGRESPGLSDLQPWSNRRNWRS
jgi:hypothetical protein